METIQTVLDRLNPAQHQAVITTEGPLLVVAGAGSGKTRVLTSRVAYILWQRLAEPYNILAVTFTNKAAREMKERITGLLGVDIRSLVVSTFHSFCALLLRRESQAAGIKAGFTIFDEDDALALIKNCLTELKIDRNQFTPRSLRRKISDAKNRMEDASAYAAKASGYFETRSAAVYTLYEKRLQECGGLDFDDLIFRAVRLLESNEAVRQNYQNRFKYILVDEYQDTNHSQYRLLKYLVGAARNICVVGDEDQSIYGWRGADITNILNFEKDFPGAQVIKLEENYRSTGNILEAASAVISNNTQRKAKTLFTRQDRGEPVYLIMTDSAGDEAQAIVELVKDNLARFTLNEMAILYRTNAQSRAFEEFFRRLNIPYQIIGGTAFYQRKEIKDILAYLKLMVNPSDDVAFARIINYPRRGIGDTSLAHLREFASARRLSLLGACAVINDCGALGGRPQKALADFAAWLGNFQESHRHQNIADLVRSLVDELRLAEELITEDSLLGRDRVANVEEFINAAREYSQNQPEFSLEGFLAEIALYADIDSYREIDDKLTLMTLHAAKGLEFNAVFMVGLEEGLFPLNHRVEDQMDLEEERRLFYVGVTRARKTLYISFAGQRARNGVPSGPPSRFLSELPPALLSPRDLRRQVSAGYGRVATLTRAEMPHDSSASSPSGYHYEYEEEEAIRHGRVVQHPTFGRGTVISVEGRGENMRLEINFPGLGVKKIIAKYARLKIVG